MNRIKNIILITTACLTCLSCIKEKLEVTYNSQEQKIDQYIESNRYVNRMEEGVSIKDTLRVINSNGSNRLITKEGTGESLSENGTIAFYYAGYIFNGSKSYSNLFATNHSETAKNADWTLTDADYSLYMMNMRDARLLNGLRNGLTGVKSGEECQIIFSGKYGFGNKEFGIIPANSALLFEIWVESVSND